MVLLRHLLGDALRRLRLRQGRTLREVSASARVSLGYLSEVERGQKEASSELLAAICSALGAPLSQVLREVSDNFALAELQSEPVFADVIEPAIEVDRRRPARPGSDGDAASSSPWRRVSAEHLGSRGCAGPQAAGSQRIPAARSAPAAIGARPAAASQISAQITCRPARPPGTPALVSFVPGRRSRFRPGLPLGADLAGRRPAVRAGDRGRPARSRTWCRSSRSSDPARPRGSAIAG